ncbi:hypothetical protein [Gallaecimonas sp. GXIMD4217]|uniref:PKD domain-containing protein n=1 Tax=Gallaecimonas sp. GXIMD4217 TaxID=3131927 RepID=UPI00311B07FD
MKTITRALPCLLSALLLSACGGGGGGTEPEKPAPNNPPSIELTNQTVTERDQVTLNATARDSDGSIAGYSWTQSSGPEVVLSGADTATLSFTAPELGEDANLVFTLTVTDDDGASTSASSTITVRAIKHALTLSGRVYDGPLPGAAVSLTISGRSEPVTTTADNDGYYRLELVVDETETEALLTLEAQSATDERVILGSWLGLASELLAQGDSLDSQRQPRLLVSHLSTARDGLIEHTLGHQATTEAEYLAATSRLEADHWLNLATLLKAVVDQGAALPAGVADTRTLARTIFDHQDWANQQSAQAGFEELYGATLADSQALPAIPLQLPTLMTEIATKAWGGGSATSWHWNAEGTGTLTLADFSEHASFHWQLEQGSWQATFADQAFRRSVLLNGTDQFEDRWLTRAKLRPIAQANGQLLVVEERWFDIERYPRNEPSNKSYDSEHMVFANWYLTDDGASPFILAAPATLGLPLPVREEHDEVIQGNNGAMGQGQARLAALFRFEFDGTGARLDNNATFQWQHSDGDLLLTWPDQSQWRYDLVRSDTTSIRVRAQTGSAVASLVRQQDWPVSNYDEPLLLGYQRDALNAPNSIFWFEIKGDGTAVAHFLGDLDGDGLSQGDHVTTPYLWTMDGEQLVMARYRDINTSQPCAETANPDCRLYNRRYWSFGGDNQGKWSLFHDTRYYDPEETEFFWRHVDIRQLERLSQAPVDVDSLPQ